MLLRRLLWVTEVELTEKKFEMNEVNVIVTEAKFRADDI